MSMLRNAALALALAGAAATAHAGIKASAVNTEHWNQNSPAQALVPLNSAGATTLTFNLSSAGKKVLTYSALCSVALPGNSSAWLDLDILVNGVVVEPTVGSADSFCYSYNANSYAAYIDVARASITVSIQGRKGQNTIQIKAQGSNSALALYLADSALVIFD